MTNPTENEVKSIIIDYSGQSSMFQQDNLDQIDKYINIEKIECVHFDRMISVLKIPKEIFKNLPYIKSLFISDYYSFVDANNFDYLQNLVYLRFLRGLQELRPRAFYGLNNLVYLNLNHGCISYLEEGCFDGLINLKFLNLETNLLREIRKSFFLPLRNLIYLNFSGTPFNNEVNLEGLVNLQYLKFDSFFSFDIKFRSNDVLNNLQVFFIRSRFVNSRNYQNSEQIFQI